MSPATTATPAAAAATAPIWALLGQKAGDNNQVLALAESLGRPFEIRNLSFRSTEILSNLLLGPTLAGVRPEARADLIPPWPSLVISAGRRNEPVARWIRQQTDDPVRLVHVGRPWAPPDTYDLIVTTRQYQVPEGPNVLTVDLPLHRVRAERIAAEADRWRPVFAELPGPRIALLVGGRSGQVTLDTEKADELATRASSLAAESGGSLLVTTSARTPVRAVSALAERITVPHHFHAWSPDDTDNPYLAFLGLADAFIVTGESMSMLTEACATRKPVYIFDMRDEAGAGPVSPGTRLRRLGQALSYRSLTHRLGQRIGPKRMRRDTSALHAALIDQGRCAWLGEPFPAGEPPPLPDASEATGRVLELLDPA